MALQNAEIGNVKDYAWRNGRQKSAMRKIKHGRMKGRNQQCGRLSMAE